MKEYRIIPSEAVVVSINVAYQRRHYFNSKKLGFCYAFEPTTPPDEKSHVDLVNELIDEIEQKPLSKGDKLAILMDCSDRIHNRWLEAFDAMHAIPENHVSRNAAFQKCKRLHDATSRITRKIIALLEASEPTPPDEMPDDFDPLEDEFGEEIQLDPDFGDDYSDDDENVPPSHCVYCGNETYGTNLCDDCWEA